MKVLKTIGICLLGYLFMFLGDLLGTAIVSPLSNSSNAGIRFGGMYASFIGIWIICIGFCLIFKPFRGLIPKLGIKEVGNNVKTALILGLILGMGLNLIVAIVAMINKDIALSYSSFNPLMLIYFIFVVMIQSGAEELIDRWFIYEKVREYFPNCPAVAIIINAVFFVTLHLINPGVTALSLLNIMIVGVLYSLVVYYYRSLWAAIVAHTTWNFCQNILLGLPNSGIVTEYSVFSLDAATAKDSFAYSVSFGIEGTILTCALLAIACVVVIYLGRKRQHV